MNDQAKKLRNEYAKKYREKNKDKLKAYQKEWRNAHREELNEKRRQWAKDHPDKIKEYNDNYWERLAERNESVDVGTHQDL